MLLDKDILDTPELPETKKPDPDKTGNCGDDCFNEYYDKLTQRKDEKVNYFLMMDFIFVSSYLNAKADSAMAWRALEAGKETLH